DIAGQGQLQCQAKTVAVQQGNCGQLQPLQPVEHRLEIGRDRAHALSPALAVLLRQKHEIGHIDARGKAGPRALQEDGAHALSHGCLAHRCVQLRPEVEVDRVALFRPVERDPQQALALLAQDQRAHAGSSTTSGVTWRTGCIASQARAMKSAPKKKSQRYWSPSTSTTMPPSVGPMTAADCEAK